MYITTTNTSPNTTNTTNTNTCLRILVPIVPRQVGLTYRPPREHGDLSVHKADVATLRTKREGSVDLHLNTNVEIRVVGINWVDPGL